MASSRSLMFLLLVSIATAAQCLADTAEATPQNLPYEIRMLSEVLEEDISARGPRRSLLQTIPQGSLSLGGGQVAAYNFVDFTTAKPFFDIYGSASFPGNRLRLTNGPNQTGKALVRMPVRFYNRAKGLAGVFGTRFTFQFLGNSRGTCTSRDRLDKCPGHGFTFTFQTPDIRAAAGIGPALGYGGGPTQSIAVEFDVVSNAANSDPNNNHIGFDSRGSVTSIFTTGTSIIADLINTNLPLTAWIEFWPQGTPIQFLLKVYLSAGTTKPATPSFTSVADPAVILSVVAQDNLAIGFTAGTGVEFSTIEILQWSFFSSILD